MADDFSLTDTLPKLVIGEGHALTTLKTLVLAMAETGDIFRQGEGPNLRGVILSESSDKQAAALAKLGVIGTQGQLLPTPLTRSHVQDYAEQNFSVIRLWKNPKTSKVIELPTDFPQALAGRVIDARLGGLRPLRGVAYTPIIRPNGEIFAVSGYDAETELWLATRPLACSLPEQPSEQEARGWLATLEELLDEHPFESEQDKVAAVAFLMTPALRASIQRAPLLLADAPYGRTGKDYLAGTAALIATGRPPVVVSLGDDREEQKKRMGHALLLGAPVVVLTNINGTLSSDELAAYLSEGGTTTRSYGTVGGAKFAANGNTIIATGNNIEPGGDLPERHIGSRQDARMEFPGDRIFQHNPHAEVRADRGKYLAAIFGLARYAIRSELDPDKLGLGGLGGFDDFNRLIRAPLFALTRLDPAWRARQQLYSARQQRPERALIDALTELFQPEVPFCTKDIACELRKRGDQDGQDDPCEPLRIKPQELGYKLRRAKGKRGSTHSLVAVERPQGAQDVAHYQLIAGKPPEGGSEEFAGNADFYPFSTCTVGTVAARKGWRSAESEESAENGSGMPQERGAAQQAKSAKPAKPANGAGQLTEPPAPYPGSQPPDELPKELRWLAEEGDYRPDLACPRCHCCYVPRRSPTPRCLICSPSSRHNPWSQPTNGGGGD
jgi:hypothetical protein